MGEVSDMGLALMGMWRARGAQCRSARGNGRRRGQPTLCDMRGACDCAGATRVVVSWFMLSVRRRCRWQRGWFGGNEPVRGGDHPGRRRGSVRRGGGRRDRLGGLLSLRGQRRRRLHPWRAGWSAGHRRVRRGGRSGGRRLHEALRGRRTSIQCRRRGGRRRGREAGSRGAASAGGSPASRRR
jgi:hypothetical protein